ncbi:tRNA dihydrouridine synthase DusB [Aquipuribacter sp. MA13-6]|uniref:tRNA dihydrouridine synthase DusB n=1 Tax=unclassified Aquipuribacter TaxID=2635084 RepID=UPI003EF0202B
MSTTTLRPEAPAGLRLGDRLLQAPVVLAPMAGITNSAFRRLCRELGGGAGLYVSEMVTSRALVERTPESLRLTEHHPDEPVKSVQLYATDPATAAAAVRMLLAEDRAEHVDLNFGCPVPKVTRKGGGAALPWKTDLFAAVVRSVVRAADGRVPVTVKMRKGIDDEHLTYLEAGRIAVDEGAAWVALHGRTAAQLYAPYADWDAIARLRDALPAEVPVLGNGDIFSAEDAVAMVARTGCDGVVVGRGCLGRPWLFADIAAALAGSDQRTRPGLAQVLAAFRRHAELLAENMDDEARACRDIRKHVSWYLKGYPVGHESRVRLALVDSLAEIDEVVAGLPADAPYPGEAAEGHRGRAGSARPVSLPEGWLASRDLDADTAARVAAAEASVSGG